MKIRGATLMLLFSVPLAAQSVRKAPWADLYEVILSTPNGPQLLYVEERLQMRRLLDEASPQQRGQGK